MESLSRIDGTMRCWLAIAGVVVLAMTAAGQSASPAGPSSDPVAVVDGPGVSPLPCPPEERSPLLFGGPCLERAVLTGDWFGCRGDLRDHGMTFDLSTTQYYQGIASGGLEQSFPYGGRNDYFLTLDAEKLGLWKGLTVTLHGETRCGESANFLTGALGPVNEYLLLPAQEGAVTALTGVKFTQHLSESVEVFLGKINTLDDLRQPLTGAAGLEGFLNVSLLFNTILARTLPYSTFGAGVSYLQDGHPVLVLSVFDTNDTPTVSGFNTFFDNGVTIFGLINLPTCFFGFPGHQGLSGTYSTGRYTNIQGSSYYDPIEGVTVQPATKTGSWCLAYNFDQALWVAPGDKKRLWGVFGNLGIADDNPNPIHWYAGGGISGASPLPDRPLDTFGIGYFYLGISGPLKGSVRSGSPLGDEQGVELYYNGRITPWFQVTPNLQIIDPIQREVNTSLVLGLRARVVF